MGASLYFYTMNPCTNGPKYYGTPQRPFPLSYGAAARAGHRDLGSFSIARLEEAAGQVEAEARRLEAVHRGDRDHLLWPVWENETMHARAIRVAIRERIAR